MKNKDKTNSQLIKDLRKQQKEAHEQQVSDKIDSITRDPLETGRQFADSKKLRWYDYISIVAISAAIIGFSFLIGIFALNAIAKTEWVLALATLTTLLTWLILGWFKNKKVAEFFNDSRRRYQTTLTTWEGHLRRILKIIFGICSILLVTTLTTWLVFYL
ncbi:hypothetical protein [Spiroplasma chinense]|uniref:hypothetical protein n=1 Tax=Spiroplasma chinense TaxID=216932 RepID=UPI0014123F9D|nr:hypothetical protein [Spiroplasma chinense]